MPCGRMQHTAVLPRGKSCSVYAANAIASTWKKNFLHTFFWLSKLWNEIGELGLIFFLNWLIPFWNPLLIICRAACFDGTDNLPIKFFGRAASNSMLQLSRRNVYIYTCVIVRLLLCSLAVLCRCVLRNIVWMYLYDLQLASGWDAVVGERYCIEWQKLVISTRWHRYFPLKSAVLRIDTAPSDLKKNILLEPSNFLKSPNFFIFYRNHTLKKPFPSKVQCWLNFWIVFFF